MKKIRTSFWSNPSRIPTSLRSCPSDADSRAFSSEKGERMKRTAAIICHEFARLVGIMIEKEEARSALLSSGVNLTRIEQQLRMDREEFWESVVARLHNDQTVIVGMSFVGLVDTDDEHSVINPSKALPQKRSGAWLKDKLFAIRASFTRAFHNWTRSRQNNPEGCDFSNFVPRAPSCTVTSTLGRFCIILFYAMKCGTEDEDTDFLNFTSKIVPHGAGYDDGDSEI